MDEPARTAPNLLDVFLAFFGAGLTAGGPSAHLADFRREFVERRGWLTDAELAQAADQAESTPGHSSTQLAIAIGLRQAGVAGGVVALAGFVLPAAAAMIALAQLAPVLFRMWGDGWTLGLKIAACAMVLQALTGMARVIAPDPVRVGLAVGAGVGAILTHGPVAQFFALAAGALFGLALLGPSSSAERATELAEGARVSARAAKIALSLAAGLFLLLPFAAWALGSPETGLAGIFFRVGALAFGGEQVLLPLLSAELDGEGWIDIDTLLAGYGAALALPGPLFAFAGFVGAAQIGATGGWLGGGLAVAAMLAPSLLLMVGGAPFWNRLQGAPRIMGALAGLQAVTVGLVAAALWDPLIMRTIVEPADWALVAAAWVFLSIARLPRWLVAVGFAVATGLFLR
ncbi:chromate efflux transporter [Phenylobacterium deserti]|uniref:Chromate transporter n=1 Tax=Phenylobacterium deserti TaxID=1914756 RepID=A0A328ANN6_9CAUL|nr:chromate efflux transporter [Phenylobacterium deserti]RAK56632.1 chromate transporter [Phenylobacterium deserti]